MKEFIDKLIRALEEESNKAEAEMHILSDSEYSLPCQFDRIDIEDCKSKTFCEAISIVNEVAEEYKQDKTFQYVLLQTDILKRMGIDVSCKWETATQNAMALEQAYMRGRQDEIDRFAEWQEEHNNGWIPCSERLPEEPFGCLVTIMDCNPMTQTDFENILPYHVGYDGETWNNLDGNAIPFEVIAWMPLPAPYTEGE